MSRAGLLGAPDVGSGQSRGGRGASPPRRLLPEGLDHDLGLVLGLDRVKVRRVMVAVVHRDHDPEEAADPRHATMISSLPDSSDERLVFRLVLALPRRDRVVKACARLV